MERKSGRGMNEDRMRKNLTKLAIFSICMTLFLGAAGITLVRVFAVTFSRTTEERMLEEVGDYKERIINQIGRTFRLSIRWRFLWESPVCIRQKILNRFC